MAKKHECYCVQSMWAVFADLIQACERQRFILDADVQRYMTGYRNGIYEAQERFRTTQSKCCCERADTDK
jgi:hypothetical protein